MNPRNWSLRARLIAVMVALLAVTSIIIGGVMFLAVKNALWGQFDVSVQNAAQRIGHRDGDDGPTGSGSQLDPGTIVAGYGFDGTTAGYYKTSGTAQSPLLRTQLSAVHRVEVGNDPLTIQVPGRGDYRFVALPGLVNGSPGKVVVGLPLTPLYKEIAALSATIVLVVLIAILLAALLGTFVLRRALRPLSRVATVATDVARMHLESGDVKLAERVPEHDTNPKTEVGQVGLALNNLLDTVDSALTVRQASEAKVRSFVADASHELRTPLAAIRGYAELTRRFGGDLSEDVLHNIARIESESKRMTSLVEDLLLLARLDAQRELEESEVDLSRLLVDVVSDAHAAGRDHTWDLELPDEPVVVRGDDARLHQVFANLLANARVHTPAGTEVTVELLKPVDETVTVLVRDTGPGIPAELQPALFERFVRGDSSRNRNTGSTGLGLSIVSAVVQAHHGSVSLDSGPGSTTFAVRLPVHQPADVEQPVPA
jgi:two-component system, OmpR family, sensor kinase